MHEDPVIVGWWVARLQPALLWFSPVRRRLWLLLGAVAVALRKPDRLMEDLEYARVPQEMVGYSLVVLGSLGLLWLVYRAAAQYRHLPGWVKLHPQLCLHAALWALLGLVWLTGPADSSWHRVLTGVAVVFPWLIWRCAYLLQAGQGGKVAATSFSDHLFYLWPAYGGSSTPYGKGYDNLMRAEAQDVEQLARSQLAGIKLLLLAVCWNGLAEGMKAVFYGSNSLLAAHQAAVPRLAVLVAQGGQASPSLGWASLYCEFFYQVLDHAAEGHQVIGILRLFGFNVFRNTYKPLYAESIVEFWNRYYYYFKEVMANFFFMPVFMQSGKWLRAWPNVRLCLAVFAAAFAGNMYFHILKKTDELVTGQVWSVLVSFESRFFYCFLLALGIFVSMWRRQRNPALAMTDVPLWRRAGRMFTVWTFFSLIYIWNVNIKQGGDFLVRVAFFLNLFGMA